jgi:hypothetical protein
VRQYVILTHEVGLLERRNDTWFGRSRDDGHRVALCLDPLQLLSHTWALLALGTELLGDLVELTSNEALHIVVWHGEVVLLLEALEHVTEVVADEVFEKRVGVVFGVDVVLLHHLVGEVCTCFEGEPLRLAEGVVAVEEDVLDLSIYMLALG